MEHVLTNLKQFSKEMQALICDTVRVDCGVEGNYFAVNASYSNDYAHVEAGEVCQMLVAYVLTGHSYHCHSDSTITKPPFRGHQGDDGTVRRRHDSVCGTHQWLKSLHYVRQRQGISSLSDQLYCLNCVSNCTITF